MNEILENLIWLILLSPWIVLSILFVIVSMGFLLVISHQLYKSIIRDRNK